MICARGSRTTGDAPELRVWALPDSPGDFVSGSAIGRAPRIIAYVSLGASGGDPTSVSALVGLGLVPAMTLVAGLPLIARRLRLRAA